MTRHGPDPGRYLAGGTPRSAVVPARVCAWLIRHGNWREVMREQRGRDAEVDAALLAIVTAGAEWRAGFRENRDDQDDAAAGTRPAPSPEPGARWLTTAQAAARLGIGDRAVRQLIAREVLQAEWFGGRWWIDEAAVALASRR